MSWLILSERKDLSTMCLSTCIVSNSFSVCPSTSIVTFKLSGDGHLICHENYLFLFVSINVVGFIANFIKNYYKICIKPGRCLFIELLKLHGKGQCVEGTYSKVRSWLWSFCYNSLRASKSSAITFDTNFIFVFHPVIWASVLFYLRSSAGAVSRHRMISLVLASFAVTNGWLLDIKWCLILTGA